jgi:beta-glucosidase
VSVDTTSLDDVDLRAGGTVTVRVPLVNDGDRPATEVVQVYVRDVESAVHRPDHELAGFARVAVEPGADATAEVVLDRRAFAWWDVQRDDWVVEAGTFEVLVGASSRDLRGRATIEVTGAEVPPRDVPAVYANPPAWLDVDRAAFEAVLGRPLPVNEASRRPFALTTPLGAVDSVPQGRLLLAALERGLRAQFGDDPTVQPLIESMLKEAPIRSLVMSGLALDQIDALLSLLNGEWGTGARKVYDQVTANLRNR